MSYITMPVGSYLLSRIGDSGEVWAMPDHTTALPRLAIYRQKPFNGSTYGFIVKWVTGHLQSDGTVKNEVFTYETKCLPERDDTASWDANDRFKSSVNDSPDFDKMVRIDGRLPSSTKITT